MNVPVRKSRVIFATQQEYAGCQRKLAWFSKHGNDLYFEIAGFFVGSHTSYHRDGNIFRTSPATENQPQFIGKNLPLKDFTGWYQLGAGMVQKVALSKNPCLKSRDRKDTTVLKEIDLGQFPSSTLNLVVELLHPDSRDLLNSESVRPPLDAHLIVVDAVMPWIILTILGHDHNLLIRPKDKGFVVSHFNSRYSANQPGWQYAFEAYKLD